VSGSRLTPLQRRILKLLAPITPPWTLAGGGALAGVHLGHRETRDLDLFWRSRADLGRSVDDAAAALRAGGLEVHVLRTAPALGELRVSDGSDACIVDLVAEPFPAVEAPEQAVVDGAQFGVDTRRELLAAKLATLIERSELRDLIDLKALLDAGEDLAAGLRDAPLKDGGFSALTLAWVLKDYDPRSAGKALGRSAEEGEALYAFSRWLIERLTENAAPR
jgi:hypothetical protein